MAVGITGWFNVVSIPIPEPIGNRIAIYGDSINTGTVGPSVNGIYSAEHYISEALKTILPQL